MPSALQVRTTELCVLRYDECRRSDGHDDRGYAHPHIQYILHAVDVSGSNPYWTDGKKVIYYEDAKLLSHEGGKVSILSEGVTGIETNTSNVYYWTGGTLYEMDPLTMDAGEIHSFKQEIDQVTIGKDGDALVQTKADDTHVQFHYIDREQRVSAPFLLLEKNSSKQVENATYEIADGQLTLFYSETARSQGVDIVFIPSVEEMYPQATQTTVSVSKLTERLCGASRPGHFDDAK